MLLGRALSSEEDKTLFPAQNPTTNHPSSNLKCWQYYFLCHF